MSVDGDLALGLWRRWFEEGGDPIMRWWDRDQCFFCGTRKRYGQNDNHRSDCVWLQARDLVTSTTVTGGYE